MRVFNIIVIGLISLKICALQAFIKEESSCFNELTSFTT